MASERILRSVDFLHGPPVGPDICGIDEAGRGPLAGPVSAACVILGRDFPIGMLDDSKALSESKREDAFVRITDGSAVWSVGWASHNEIDMVNILNATFLAMRRAFACLPVQPGTVYVDGNRIPDLSPFNKSGFRVIPVIGGDALIPAIMAASIIAKVMRDRVMLRFDTLYPEYRYARHKGYPTKAHRTLCSQLGPSPIQRISFSIRET